MGKADAIIVGGVYHSEERGDFVSLKTYNTKRHNSPASANDQFIFWITMAEMLLEKTDLPDWQRSVLQDTLAYRDMAQFPRACVQNLH